MTRCNYNVDEVKCRNTATIGERCNEHPIVWVATVETEPQTTGITLSKDDVLPMTPQQKAAKTRAAKKAKLKKEIEELEDESKL